jgi:type IV pilus assembly protein PilF
MTNPYRFRSLFVLLLTASFIVSACTADLARRKKQSESFRNLGEAYMIEGRLTLALKELLRAQEVYAEDPYLQNDLGLAYMGRDKLDLAIVHFNKAVALKPEWPNARNNLATAYMRQERWDTAIGYLSELSEDLLYTTPHYAHLNLGWAYFNKADYGRARTFYRQALKHYEDGFKKDGTYLKALAGLGRTHLATGRVEVAIRFLERAMQFAPDVAGVHLHLGRAYAKAGKAALARSAFQKVMALAPESEMADEARTAEARLE